MDKFVEKAIINSYEYLTGTTLAEILENDRFPCFLFSPTEKYDNEDLDTMIDYFITTEEYEKCAILTKMKK